MPSFDFFGDLPEGPTVRERLESYLSTMETPLVFDMAEYEQCRVMALPSELLDHIMDFLPSKIDLARVCKVNTRFFAVATPKLYRNIHLPITDTLNPHHAQMFTASNVGLRFTRRVAVTSTNGNNLEAAYQWLEIFVNQFPANRLLSFTWNPPHAIPARITNTLWDRQRKLERMEILPTHFDRFDNQGNPIQDNNLLTQLNNIDFANSEAVRVVPDTTDTAWLGCAALQHGYITKLEVDARVWQLPHSGDEDDDDDDEDQTAAEPLTECLFDHLPRVEPGLTPTHDCLTTLILKDIDLSDCKRTWCTYLDLRYLKELNLEHCKGADVFLLKIAPGASTPALRAFSFVHTVADRSDVTTHAINELLQFPRNCLKTLTLCLRNSPELPKKSAIRGHGKTLKKLLLDITSNTATHGVVAGYPTYEYHALESMFESFTALKELGIALPSYGLEYKSFTQEHDLRGEIDLIARTLNLSILNILNLPQEYQSRRSPGYYAAKAPQLGRLAADIFSRHRRYDHLNETFVAFDMHTKLEIVAFGVRDRNIYHPQPVYFLPSEIGVVGRRRRYHAEGVSLQYLRRHRMEGQIIDYERRDFDTASRRSFQYYDVEALEEDDV